MHSETLKNSYPYLTPDFMRGLLDRQNVIPLEDVRAPKRKLKNYPKGMVERMARQLEKYGCPYPILLRSDHTVADGELFYFALQQTSATHVPVLYADHLSDAQISSYGIFLANMARKTEWNAGELRLELNELLALDDDLDLGFTPAELDLLLEDSHLNEHVQDLIPAQSYIPVSQPGDIWLLGEHRIICGDALNPATYAALLQQNKAVMMFTDPPYNVKINGHVKKQCNNKHREFAMASGEMDCRAFNDFLRNFLTCSASSLTDGAIAYVCMDWRHMQELLTAAEGIFSLKNLCVWTKDRAGMGSFYRSQHELVFAYKYGTAPHINNFELGQHGRYRSNVWTYPMVRMQGTTNDIHLSHPTPKPVDLVAEAIRDCSLRGNIILDPFGGSGTTLIAAEITGRKACLIELDPAYCDLMVMRWQRQTGRKAFLEATGECLEAIREERRVAKKSEVLP